MARFILLERANFGLWGDIASVENKVPPPVTSCHLLGVSPSLPLWVDVIYGWSLIQDVFYLLDILFCCSRNCFLILKILNHLFIFFSLRIVILQFGKSSRLRLKVFSVFLFKLSIVHRYIEDISK